MSATQHMMNQEIDRIKLDKLARTNPNAKQTQLELMFNAIRKSGNMFDYVTEAKVQAIAERLQYDNYGAYETELAMERIVKSCQKFPSYKEIREVANTYKPKKVEKGRSQKDKDEDKEYEKLRKQYIEVLGADKLEPFCLWWVKNVLQMDARELESFGFNPIIFLRCALFDWRDANFKDFERIKRIGRSKMEKLKKERQKEFERNLGI